MSFCDSQHLSLHVGWRKDRRVIGWMGDLVPLLVPDEVLAAYFGVSCGFPRCSIGATKSQFIIRQQLSATRDVQVEKRHLLASTHKSNPGRAALHLVRFRREAIEPSVGRVLVGIAAANHTIVMAFFLWNKHLRRCSDYRYNTTAIAEASVAAVAVSAASRCGRHVCR